MDAWFSTTSCQLQSLPQIPAAHVEAWKEKVRALSKVYERTHELTCSEAEGPFRKKTLHGRAYDQNRLGKGIPGFEGFYIEGSEIKLLHRTYDVMSAPLIAMRDKEETVTDFWNCVVVLRKSPIIVTVHDPQEKQPAQRAAYWTHDRFKQPIALKAGWTLMREGTDEVIKESSHASHIRLVKRVFVATHTSSETHRVTQYHLQGWRDHVGAPDHELFEKLHQVVDQEIELRNVQSRPITVHCAAGQGRACAFVVSNHSRLEALSISRKEGTPIGEVLLNLPKTIYEMRKQRPHLLAEVAHWHTIILSLRRLFLQHMGVKEEVIRQAETPYEIATV